MPKTRMKQTTRFPQSTSAASFHLIEITGALAASQRSNQPKTRKRPQKNEQSTDAPKDKPRSTDVSSLSCVALKGNVAPKKPPVPLFYRHVDSPCTGMPWPKRSGTIQKTVSDQKTASPHVADFPEPFRNWRPAVAPFHTNGSWGRFLGGRQSRCLHRLTRTRRPRSFGTFGIGHMRVWMEPSPAVGFEIRTHASALSCPEQTLHPHAERPTER